MYAFCAFVCGSSSVRGVSCLDVNIMVDVLRTAEEAKTRLPLRYPLLMGDIMKFYWTLSHTASSIQICKGPPSLSQRAHNMTDALGSHSHDCPIFYIRSRH